MADWTDKDGLTTGDSPDRELPRLDGRQETLRQRLADINSVLADLYLGALWIAQQAPPSAGYFLAHAAREIENVLRPRLLAQASDRAAGEEGQCESGEADHAGQIAVALSLPREDPVVAHWFGIAKQFAGLSHAHRDPAEGPRSLAAVLPLWEDYEEVLYAVLAPYYDVVPAIDELLTVESPTNDHIENLKALLARTTRTRRRYFFSRLQHVGWLRPLDDARFFVSPPAPLDFGDGSVSHPFWPEAEYLVRMAKEDPSVVHEIILRILKDDHVKNVSFLCDCVEAALHMPADLAKNIAARARRWQGPLHFTLPDSLRKLVCKLANGGEVKTALRLTACAMAVTPDLEGIDRVRREGGDHSILPPPVTRMDVYDYEQFLTEAFPDLAREDHSGTLRLACDLLEKTLQFRRYGDQGLASRCREANPDYSFIWRPNITEQARHGAIKDLLATAVLHTARQIVEETPSAGRNVLDALEERPFPIFMRVGLYLLSLNPLADAERATRWLTDGAVLGDAHYRAEYHLLALAAYPALPESAKQQVLRAIDALVDEREASLRSDATSRSEDDIQGELKRHRVRLMQLLADVLPAEAKASYEKLVAEVGAPMPLGDACRIETRVGSPSPLSKEQLAQLPPAEAAEFLRTWVPPTDEVWGPEPEGLGRVLEEVVQQQPERYATDAMAFVDVDPTYARHLLGGLLGAVKTGNSFPWQQVIDLCAWVLDQPDTTIRRHEVHTIDLDPDWGWTRKEIADLLEHGVRNDVISFGLRPKVWQLVKRLAADPDPTPEREDRPDAMGPATLAINTVRGEAMHCAVHYALWCARALRPDDPTLANKPPFAIEIPEVLELLDEHLDPTREPSAAIRSVYGQYLPRLMLLAPEWLRARIDSIFPSRDGEHGLWWAAWTAYVGFNRPYWNLFPLLRGQYARALGFFDEPAGEDWIGADAHKRLAHHLVILYWHSQIELDDELLTDFFATAPAELCGEVLNFVGRSLSKMDTAPETHVVGRLQQLLSARIDAVRQTDLSTAVAELAEFGWCFQSGALDEAWSLSRLLTVLDLTGGIIKPSNKVIERLSALAPGYIEQVVECARRMVLGGDQEWRMFGWRPHLRNILQIAIEGDCDPARDTAITLVHELGERGNDEYLDLLS